MNKIKNCPFCGSTVLYNISPHGTVYFKCINKNCNVLIDTLVNNTELAINIFNYRCKGE